MKHLTKISIVTLVFISLSNVFAQTDTLSTDAIYLALRSQEQVHLDSSLAWNYQSALDRAYEVEDSMRYVHVFPPYVNGQIILNTNADWASAWDSGSVWTGDPFIDSLGLEYDLYDVKVYTWFYILKFNSVFQAWRLGDIYEMHPEVNYAEPNGFIGDGDDIVGFQKNDSTYFGFSIGWGDCLAGCIHRYYWMIRTSENDAMLYWEGGDFDGIPIWDIVNVRWNGMLPEDYSDDYSYYCFTYFENADSLYHTILYSSKWWERLYAVEVLWRFYVENMWCGNQYNQWQSMKNYLNNHYDQSITVLLIAMNDSDHDVQAAAQHALDMLENVSTELEIILPNFIQLFPSYPNPFNPKTTIRFDIGVKTQHAASLQIYDLTVRLVETLVNGKLVSGEHEIVWNAGHLPSGVYFVRLQSGEFVENQKVIFLK